MKFYKILILFLFLVSLTSINVFAVDNISSGIDYYTLNNSLSSVSTSNVLSESGISYTTGKIGNGSYFDNNADYLRNTSFNFGYNKSFSFGFGLKLNSTYASATKTNNYVLSDNDIGTANTFLFKLNIDSTDAYKMNLIMCKESVACSINTGYFTMNTTSFDYVVLIYNGSTHIVSLYVNDALYYNGTFTDSTSVDITSGFSFGNSETAGYAISPLMVVDELSIYNRVLSSSEVSDLYNKFMDLDSYPFDEISYIVFNHQDPSDITSTNIFGNPLNITYNVTDNNATLSSIKLNYTLPSNIFINGTMINNNYNISYTTNNTNVTYSWILLDNAVYPGTYNYNESLMESTSHNFKQITNNNEQWKIELLDVNNSKSYNIFELMINTTGTNSLYYCNSSYTSGQPQLNNNCVLFSSQTSNSFNHTHNPTYNYSKHNVFSLPINTTSGKIGNVAVTNTSYIIIKYLSGVTTFGFINDSVRNGAFQSSSNNGNTWTTNNTLIIDAHLHQFNTGDNFTYNACYSNTTNTSCTSLRTDTYDLTPLPPTSPQIQYPNNNTISANGINTLINYTPSITYSSGVTIQYYNISLLNNDFTYNKTINGTTNSTNFNWTTNVTTAGYYYIKVEAKDSLNQTNYAISDTFYIYEQHLNLSAKNNITNATILNFSINITNMDWINGTSLTTTNGNVTIYSNYNTNLIFTIDSSGYALTNYTFNSNTSGNNYTFPLYPTNSVYITVVNQLTNVLINTNTTNVVMRSETYNNNSNTTNGYSGWSNLPVGNYTIQLTAPGYANANYEIVVYDRTTQQITARLLPNTSYITVGFYVKDEIFQPLTQALITIQRQYIGGSWATTNQIYTDTNGFSYVPVQEGEIYRFIISADGYVTKQFDMALFSALSPYTFNLVQTTGSIYTNYYQGVNYYYTPTNKQLNQSIHNFTITTYNSSLDISWTSVNANGAITNVTGSPSGSTASTSVDLTSWCGVFPVNYSFYFYNTNLGGYYQYNIPVNYYISCMNETQTSMPDVWDNYKNEVDSNVWTTIIAMMLTLAIVITLIQLSGNQALGIVGGIIGLAFFGYVEWISPIFAIITGLIGSIMLFLNRG